MRKLLGLLLVAAVTPAGATAQQSECDGSFHVVHALGSMELNDLDFAAPNDGWAVGFDYENEEASNERPLVIRFDDNSFERITPPHDPSVGTELQGVAALAPDDVHAVGHSYGAGRGTETVAFHWDGTEWVQLDVPSPGKQTWLRAVSAVAPDDIWAVGDYSRRGGDAGATLVLHFDGTEWSRIPSPEPGRYAALWDVEAVSATEAWAVGARVKASSDRARPLALRWNGNEWKRRSFGLEFPRSESLYGLDVVTPDDIWAVGDGADGELVLHYDGTEWSIVDLSQKRGSELLNEVAATATEAWMVGHRFVRRPFETAKPLAALFSEGALQHVAFAGDRYGDVEAVALDHAGAAWAVGETFDPEGPDLGDVIEKACL